jgi:hypothetical protein
MATPEQTIASARWDRITAEFRAINARLPVTEASAIFTPMVLDWLLMTLVEKGLISASEIATMVESYSRILATAPPPDVIHQVTHEALVGMFADLRDSYGAAGGK